MVDVLDQLLGVMKIFQRGSSEPPVVRAQETEEERAIKVAEWEAEKQWSSALQAQVDAMPFAQIATHIEPNLRELICERVAQGYKVSYDAGGGNAPYLMIGDGRSSGWTAHAWNIKGGTDEDTRKRMIIRRYIGDINTAFRKQITINLEQRASELRDRPVE